MLLAGKSSRVLRTFNAPLAKCSNCSHMGKKGAWRYTWFQVFFLPFVPLSRTVETTCPHCGHHVAGSQHSSEELAELKDFKGYGWPPLYLFSGVLLIALSALYVARQQSAAHTAMRTMLLHPQVNDTYLLQSPEATEPYCWYRVVRHSKLGVLGQYAYNAHATLEDAEKDAQLGRLTELAYWNATAPKAMNHNELLGLYYDDFVHAANREENAYIVDPIAPGVCYLLPASSKKAATLQLFRVVEVLPDSIAGVLAAQQKTATDFEKDQQAGAFDKPDFWQPNITKISRMQLYDLQLLDKLSALEPTI